MNIENNTEITDRLDILRQQPARGPEKAVQGRLAFLDQAQAVANDPHAPVSAREKRRHIGWMQALQTVFSPPRKEHSLMATLATILLVVSLVLGGGGVTVAAAQTSLPDQPLYAVKTWSEDLRARYTASEQARLDLALELAERRAVEMQSMLMAGQTPPESVEAGFQLQNELALQVAARQAEPQAAAALARIQAQLQAQQQAFAQAQAPADPQSQAILRRVRDMVNAHLHLCQTGLDDPAMLRQQLRDRDQRKIQSTIDAPRQQSTGAAGGSPWTTGTPGSGGGYGPGAENGSGVNNPWTTGTPSQGSGYGPGPADGSGDGQPVEAGTQAPGYGPGPAGDGSGDGQPALAGTPAPGYGPGPGDGSGQPLIVETPVPGDGAGPGPGSDDSGGPRDGKP